MDIVERLRHPENNWNSGGRFEAADEIERLRALLTWHPIETAPKDGTIIWATDPTRAYEGKVVFISGEWECIDWKGFGMGVGFYPSHWMPLPALPAS